MPSQSVSAVSASPSGVRMKAPTTGPKTVPSPPTTGREDQLDRAVDVEHAAREQIVVIEGHEDAADGGHRRGDQHRRHLGAEYVDAERARRGFVLAYGEPLIAEPAAREPCREGNGDGGERQAKVVEQERPAAQIPPAAG